MGKGKDQNNPDVIIIGAGAAGLFAAKILSENGLATTVLERNPKAGKKLLMTGNGKGNLTNLYWDETCYHSEDADRVKQVLTDFSPMDTMAAFEAMGCMLYERDGYVYPVTNQAQTLRDLLVYNCQKNGGVFSYDTFVTDIHREKNGFVVQCEHDIFKAPVVLLSSGGKSYPKTGSDGSMYSIVGGFGHKIRPPQPALCGLCVTDGHLKIADGVRVTGKVSLNVNGTFLEEYEGELQIHKDFISGIPIMCLSSPACRAIADKKEVRLHIDLMTGYTLKELTAFLLERKQFFSAPGTTFGDYVSGLLHYKIMSYLALHCGVSNADRLKELPDAVFEKLAKELKDLTFAVTKGKDYDSAQTTSGGVLLHEVNDTMESVKVPGLYFAGEILDADGICGGYNLQWAFSTASLAAKGIIHKAQTGSLYTQIL